MTRALTALLFVLSSAGMAAGESDVPASELFQLHCSGCHGPTGAGIPPDFPSLRALADVARADGGRAYLGRVPGVAQAALDDRDLARLLDWVIVTLSGVDEHEPYAASEIAALRARPLRDPVAARPAPARTD